MQKFITVPISDTDIPLPQDFVPPVPQKPVVPVVSPSHPSSRYSYHEALQQKVRGTLSENSGYIQRPQPNFVDESIEKFPQWWSSIETQSKPTQSVPIAQPKSPTLGEIFSPIIHSISITLSKISPIAVAAVVIFSSVAFLAGRLSSHPSNEVSAQAPVPIVASTSQPQIQQTPDEIVASAQSLFQKAISLSTAANATQESKQQVSDNIHQALDILNQGITQYSDIASLYFQRAQIEKVVAQSSDQLKFQGKQDYLKAIQLSPKSADYAAGYADFLLVTGDVSDALTQATSATALDSKNTNALFVLAQVQEATHDITSALATYDQLLSLVPANSTDYNAILARKQKLMPQGASTSNIPASASATMLPSNSMPPQPQGGP